MGTRLIFSTPKFHKVGCARKQFRYYAQYGYILPLVIILSLIIIYPTLYNIGVAFYQYNVIKNSWVFVGFHNFLKTFTSPQFWSSFKITLIWVFGNISLQMILGMVVALTLNKIKFLRGIISGAFLIPWISSYVIVAVLWLWVYHPQLGVLNDILLRLHIIKQPILWLATPELAHLSLIITNSWKFFPLVMITLFAGLQDIPKELVEVAEVEGATRSQVFRYVIFPYLLPSISTALLISIIWAFNSFTLPFIMTGGGPLRATEIMGLFIYKQAFVSYDFGSAAAASIFLFFQILIVIFFYLKLVGKEN